MGHPRSPDSITGQLFKPRVSRLLKRSRGHRGGKGGKTVCQDLGSTGNKNQVV